MKWLLSFVVIFGFSQFAFSDSTLPEWLKEETVNGEFLCGKGTTFIIDTHSEKMNHIQNGVSTVAAYELKVSQDHVVFRLAHTWIIFWRSGKVETLFQYECEKVAS